MNPPLLDGLDDAEREGWSRPVATARAEATEAQLEEKLPEVAAANRAERGGFLAAITTGATAVVTGVVAKLGDAVEWIAPLKALADDVPWFVWGGGALAGSVALYYVARQAGDAARASTEAYQEGART